MQRATATAPTRRAPLHAGGEAPVEKSPETRFLVEDYTPLTESILWQLLANYYKKMAVEAWSHNYVPMFVTSNSKFARSYAKAILAFLTDWFRRPEVEPTPIYILEIGGGHGRFTFLVLRHLLRMQNLFEGLGLPKKPFQYIFSDVAEANVSFCRNHVALRQFVEAGWLDFALFNASIGSSNKELNIKLLESGTTLPRGSPILIIANYVIDSLLTDGFCICNAGDGNIRWASSEVAIYSSCAEVDRTEPDIISRMSLRWRWSEFEFPRKLSVGTPTSGESNAISSVSGPNCAIPQPLDLAVSESAFFSNLLSWKQMQSTRRAILSTPATMEFLPNGKVPDYLKTNSRIQAVLESYLRQSEHIPGYQEMSFVIPVGTMMLFDLLYEYSGGKLICFIGDKGYKESDEFRGVKAPHVAIHGSVSFMCNLHAIKEYFSTLHGVYLSTPYKDSFQILFCYAVEGMKGPQDMPHSTLYVSAAAEDIPPDGLVSLQKHCQDLITAGQIPPLRVLLVLLRYSGHDPDLFLTFRKELISQCVAPFLGPRAESDLQKDLERVYEHWYKIRPHEDVPDALAQLSMKTGRLDRAVFYFKESLEWCPESKHAATFVNMAACYKALGKLAEAREALQNAFNLSPDFAPAWDLRRQILMSDFRCRLGFIGCGRWTFDSIVPILLVDTRSCCKAAFSFNRQHAEALREALGRSADDFDVYSGAAGFNELISRSDIQAFVVDIHPSFFLSVAERLWQTGKHIFSTSPIALTATEANKTMFRYLDVARPVVSGPGVSGEHLVACKPAWHVACAARYEDAFEEAAKFLMHPGSKLGQPIAFSYVFTKDNYASRGGGTGGLNSSLGSPARDLFAPTEALCFELLNAISILSVVLKANVIAIRAMHATASSPPDATPVTFNGTKSAAVVATEPNTQADRASFPSPSSLTGWISFETIGSKAPTSRTTVARTANGASTILGSYFITLDTATESHSLEISCTNGTARLSRVGNAWTFSTNVYNGSSNSTAHASAGFTNCYDSWLKQIFPCIFEDPLSGPNEALTHAKENQNVPHKPVSETDTTESKLQDLETTAVSSIQDNSAPMTTEGDGIRDRRCTDIGSTLSIAESIIEGDADKSSVRHHCEAGGDSSSIDESSSAGASISLPDTRTASTITGSSALPFEPGDASSGKTSEGQPAAPSCDRVHYSVQAGVVDSALLERIMYYVRS